MRFGVCTELSNAILAHGIGFDYVDLGVSKVLMPIEERHDLGPIKEKLAHTGFAPEVFNLLIPASLRVTGSSRDLFKLEAYMRVTCRRAAQLGGKLLVFGSGGARRVDDGYSYGRAWSEIREFLQMSAAAAAAYDMCIAIEPLNRNECNILTSVGEADVMALEVGSPEQVAVLSDLYHVFKDNQTYNETTRSALNGSLRHVHIACASDRHAPRHDDLDELTRYFRALIDGGYNERVSIEANWASFESEAPTSLEVIRDALAAASNSQA